MAANTHEQPLVYDPMQLSLSERIEARIEAAAAEVVLSAPLSLLERGHTFGTSIYWEPGQTWGYTPLPHDFLRLVAFEMSDWSMAVTEPITPEHPEYWQQRLPYRGLGGNPRLPICAVVNRPEGLVLEFYSCASTDAYVSQAFYAPRPTVVDGAIDLCENLYHKIIKEIANRL